MEDNSNKPTDNPVIANTSVLNEGQIQDGRTNCGPLIDVERLRQEYLFGIPMRAALTGDTISDNTLKQFIRKAISDFETSVRIPVTPVKIEDRFDFERWNDLQFSTRQLTRWPVLKVTKLAALWPGRSEGEETIYPTGWVTPQGDSGLVRIVPTSGSILDNGNAQFVNSVGYQGLAIGNMKQWPNLWRIEFIAGFDFDKVPDAVNDLIGTIAAIKFLSQMGPAIFPFNSISTGIDGMSQGTSNAGPQWLAQRMQELQAEAQRMTLQLKAHYGTDQLLTWI